MIRKPIALLNILIAAVSFYLIAVRSDWGFVYWLLSSTAPFMILTAVAVFFKIRILQGLLLPALLFFSIGALAAYEFTWGTFFAILGALVMLAAAIYIIVRNISKLVIVRLLIRFLIGTVLLGSFLFLRERIIPEPELREITAAEINIFDK